MRKILSIAIITLSIFSHSYAQLNKLCPISSTVYDKAAVKGMNLLLNTKDFTPIYNPGHGTSLTSTVQLVNAAQPFPPLWFQMGNPETDTAGFAATSFLADIKIQKNNGNLTFYKFLPDNFSGRISIDTANLIIIDNLSTYKTSPDDLMMMNIDLHDYDIDAEGNKLFANQLQRKINAACLSGLEGDSVRKAVMNDIIILNPKDSVIFKWNPLDHLSACEMNWNYRNSSLKYGDAINWSHVNSVKFANDGNILYSFRHIGIGKINRKTGEIMWKLGGKDSLNAISLPDTAGYYLQHNFIQREDGMYSVFSNGDSTHHYLEGLVYKIDAVKKTATLISRYKPEPFIYSEALGSYDCKDDTCIICFGMYLPKYRYKDSQEMGQILVGKKIIASISGPPMNFSYQMHMTKWAAAQRRPKITLKRSILSSDTKEGLHDYTWYKIDSTSAIPVGTGITFSPAASGKYVVEAQQGTGIFISFLVSDVFTYTKTNK